MAIISGSKRFIRSPSCQKVIGRFRLRGADQRGHLVWPHHLFGAQHARLDCGCTSDQDSLMRQNYKKKPIQMYNPHKAPLLDHYR